MVERGSSLWLSYWLHMRLLGSMRKKSHRNHNSYVQWLARRIHHCFNLEMLTQSTCSNRSVSPLICIHPLVSYAICNIKCARRCQNSMHMFNDVSERKHHCFNVEHSLKAHAAQRSQFIQFFFFGSHWRFTLGGTSLTSMRCCQSRCCQSRCCPSRCFQSKWKTSLWSALPPGDS